MFNHNKNGLLYSTPIYNVDIKRTQNLIVTKTLLAYIAKNKAINQHFLNSRTELCMVTLVKAM